MQMQSVIDSCLQSANWEEHQQTNAGIAWPDTRHPDTQNYKKLNFFL